MNEYYKNKQKKTGDFIKQYCFPKDCLKSRK